MTTISTKLPRKRERTTSLTLTVPSALAAKLVADAKANVRTPQQQAIFILLRHYEMLPDGQSLDLSVRKTVATTSWVNAEPASHLP